MQLLGLRIKSSHGKGAIQASGHRSSGGSDAQSRRLPNRPTASVDWYQGTGDVLSVLTAVCTGRPSFSVRSPRTCGVGGQVSLSMNREQACCSDHTLSMDSINYAPFYAVEYGD